MHNNYYLINSRLDGKEYGYLSQDIWFDYKDLDREDTVSISDDIFIHEKYREGFGKHGNKTDLTLEERIYKLYGIALIRLNKPIDVKKYKVTIVCSRLASRFGNVSARANNDIVVDEQHIFRKSIILPTRNSIKTFFTCARLVMTIFNIYSSLNFRLQKM